MAKDISNNELAKMLIDGFAKVSGKDIETMCRDLEVRNEDLVAELIKEEK